MGVPPDPSIAPDGASASPPEVSRDEHFMLRALELARAAAERGEVPVGALIVLGDEIVAEGHNLREADADPTAHAELLVLRAAARALGAWRLLGATLYVTLEPCPMCAGALVNARVERVVYGARDPKAGALDTLYSLGRDPRLNHRFESRAGVLESACAEVLRDFFRARRKAVGSSPAVPPAASP